ncbi:hypothetical protein EMMF5_002502 [Cystobasidiomycetes sp. EMM_F5]
MSRITRSRSSTAVDSTLRDASSPSPSPSKRSRRNGDAGAADQNSGAGTSTSQIPSTPPPVKRARKASNIVPATPNPAPELSTANIANPDDSVDNTADIVVRPELSFDYQEARRHLCRVDPRFTTLFETLPCKPFTEQTDLNPFRALCCSILGQQISWLAARSITHKFIRLVAFPDLPEKPEAVGMTTHFPTPRQVVSAPVATLRAAGLSQRKAEYVQDLAARFADGRLSARTLMAMSDEEVMTALTAVRGIGPWTVEMFMMFTLRRPNVLPCGDLGVQKGLIRWLTQVNPGILAKKLPQSPAVETNNTPASTSASASVPLSDLGQPSAVDIATVSNGTDASTDADAFQAPSTPSRSSGTSLALEMPLMTPRTERIAQLPALPENASLTRQDLKARLNKKVKFAIDILCIFITRD